MVTPEIRKWSLEPGDRRRSEACKNCFKPVFDIQAFDIPYNWSILTVYVNTFVNHVVFARVGSYQTWRACKALIHSTFRNFDTRNGFSEGGRGEERGRKKAGLRYSRTPVTRTLKGNSSSYRGGLQNSFSVLKIDTCWFFNTSGSV